MSVQVMSWVLKNYHKGAPTKKLVLLVLADFADANGVCWPSNTTVTENADLVDVRHTRRLISQLEEEGYVKRYDQFKDNQQRSSLTVIVMDRTPALIDDLVARDYDFYLPHTKGGGSTDPGGRAHRPSRGGATDPPGGGSTDPTEPPLRTTSDPPLLPAGAGEIVGGRADTASSLEKEGEGDDRGRELFLSYLEVDWVSPELMLNRVNFGDMVAFKALAEAVSYRDHKTEVDGLQIAIQMYMDELEAATTPEQSEDEEPVYEGIDEDGNRPFVRAKKAKGDTDFQIMFLKACKRNFFESEAQRTQVAKIEAAMLKQEREAADNVGKPLGQWSRPYIMGRLEWAAHENQLMTVIGPRKLIKAIVNPDNFARWQEFQSDGRYARKKKGGVNATQVVIGSKITADTRD